MAFTGNPSAIGQAGEMFRGMPDNEPEPPQQLQPTPPLPAPLGGEVPLSDGLVSMHNGRVTAAVNFESSVREGLVATGNALVGIGTNVTNLDDRSAAAIGRQSPDPAAGTGGGR